MNLISVLKSKVYNFCITNICSESLESMGFIFLNFDAKKQGARASTAQSAMTALLKM